MADPLAFYMAPILALVTFIAFAAVIAAFWRGPWTTALAFIALVCFVIVDLFTLGRGA